MDRIASLLKSAGELRRKIWASLPWGYRVAHLFLVLADAGAAARGKLIYAMFLQHGVKGMPDIHGKPAEEWFAALPPNISGNINALVRKLPDGYGSLFGHKLQKIVLVIARRPDKTDDELQKLVMYLLEGGIKHMREGVDLHTAENYVGNAAQNRAYNIQKSERREQGRGHSLTVEDSEGAPVQLDINDADMMDDLDEAFPIRQILNAPKTRNVLNRIHPDAMIFVDLTLQGYNTKEIVGDPKFGVESMLPHFNESGQSNNNFIQNHIPRINEALLRLVKDNQLLSNHS